MAANVSTIDRGERRVARRTRVPAMPAEVFALVADQRRSGSDAAPLPTGSLLVGSRFAEPRRLLGVPYTIPCTVTACEQDRLLEWRHPAGHRWC